MSVQLEKMVSIRLELVSVKKKAHAATTGVSAQTDGFHGNII